MNIRTFYLCTLGAILSVSTSAQQAEWYPLQLDQDYAGRGAAASVVNASGWIDAPAGRHGWLGDEGDDYRFEDGTPVKFWGVNICDEMVYPTREEAERRCAYLTHYGVNAVRFHKFTWCSTQTAEGSTVVDGERFARMDYFHARLRECGIYTGWSHIYGHRVQPADSVRLLAYDEIRRAGSDHLRGSTIGLVHFMPNLQELSIELTVNMLNHVNPHTGLLYADDPALAFIEFQNEDNAFFATTIQMMEACPTYKAAICRRFTQWLRGRYATHEALAEAWGGSLNIAPECYEGEHLDRDNIHPLPNHWFYSNDCLDRFPQWRQRLYDSARFIFECQQEYYARMTEAIRATGYGGALVGSCWQAGDNIGHYYNLYADYCVGAIDRHNYWGGGGGHTIVPGPYAAEAMVSRPGSGLYGTGLQQTDGRPFVLSEWMSLIPNEWVAEAGPLIALYGLGLQGWDASYAFASDHSAITPTIHSGWGGVYNVDSPLQSMLYPALFRMISHGDIRRGRDVATCRLHVPSFAEGRLGFRQQVEQQGDRKEFSGAVAPEVMAVGRVSNRFVKRYSPDRGQDRYEKYYDPERQEYRSTTGQFVWNVADGGYFTMQTPCSRAFVGFNPGGGVAMGDCGVRLDAGNPFAVVLLTSLERGVPLRRTSGALLTVVSRARNTGMRYDESGARLVERGGAPLLLEPVTFDLRLPRAARIHLLDHNGRRTGRSIEGADGGRTFSIDGSQSRTLYYEVEFI